MERRESRIGSTEAQQPSVRTTPSHLRFRTEIDPSADPMRRRWQAVYSYGEGWARFNIAVNLNRGTLALHRTQDADYAPMLRQLMGKPNSVTPIPPANPKVESMSFDIDILGYKMTRITAGEFQAAGLGDWLVVQAYVPRSAESFVMGVNDRMNTGEIVIPRTQSVPAVLHVLSQIFG